MLEIAADEPMPMSQFLANVVAHGWTIPFFTHYRCPDHPMTKAELAIYADEPKPESPGRE